VGVGGAVLHVQRGGVLQAPDAADAAAIAAAGAALPLPLPLLRPLALLSTAPARLALPRRAAAAALHCRLHGQSLAIRTDAASILVPSTGGAEGVALFSLAPNDDAQQLLLPGRARAVLLCADAGIVAECASLAADLGGIASGDAAALAAAEEAVERAVTLLGYALRPDASQEVLLAAAEMALRRGWVATSRRLLAALPRAARCCSAADVDDAAAVKQAAQQDAAPQPQSTLLHAAVASGAPQLVAAVLALRTNWRHAAVGEPASRAGGGVTPLHLAATLPSPDCAALLTAHSPDAALAWFTAACVPASLAGLQRDGHLTPAAVATRGAAAPAFARLRADLISRLRTAEEERELSAQEYAAWCFEQNRRIVAVIAISQLCRGLVTLSRARSVVLAGAAADVAGTLRGSELLVLSGTRFFDASSGAAVALEALPWPLLQRYASAYITSFFFTRLPGNGLLFLAVLLPRLRAWTARHFGAIYCAATLLEAAHAPVAEYVALYRPHGLVISYFWTFGGEHVGAFLLLSGVFVRGTFGAMETARGNAALVITRFLLLCGCAVLAPGVAARSAQVQLHAVVSLLTLASMRWNLRRLRRLAAAARHAAKGAKQA
jgi:hypothetical protein